MIKAIASDLDGTLLLNGAQALNPEIFDIIAQLKEHGIHFISASGRQLASQYNLFKPVVNEISYIAENGAVCVYEGETIIVSEMDRELILCITQEICKRPGCKPLVSCPSTCYILDNDEDFYYHVSQEMHNHTTKIARFEDIKEPFLKLAFFEDDVTESSKYFRELFKNEAKVITSGNEWVDFMPFDTNKATALKLLLHKMGISPDEVISFGDQQNDVEMLTLTATSYAMAKAVPEAKACADFITESVEESLREFIKALER